MDFYNPTKYLQIQFVNLTVSKSKSFIFNLSPQLLPIPNIFMVISFDFGVVANI